MIAGCRASLLAGQSQEAALHTLLAEIMPAIALDSAADG